MLQLSEHTACTCTNTHRNIAGCEARQQVTVTILVHSATVPAVATLYITFKNYAHLDKNIVYRAPLQLLLALEQTPTKANLMGSKLGSSDLQFQHIARGVCPWLEHETAVKLQ